MKCYTVVCAFRSYLDMLKLFAFSYFFWLVLCLIFITGTTRINIFCLGYLVACFYFMLFGGTLLLQPVQYVLRFWDGLIAYTCVVISLKNMLSVSTSFNGLMLPWSIENEDKHILNIIWLNKAVVILPSK